MKTFTILVLGLLASISAWSGTPDGETPANEGICDLLVDHTPGLYGLCVAYCEAHDAHIISPGGDLSELNAPNRKLLENYRKKMQAGDPDMPCVQSTACPCWTLEQLAALPPPTTAEGADANFPDACHADLGSALLLENLENGLSNGFQLVARTVNRYCSVYNTGFPDGPPNVGVFVTAEEVAECQEDIRDRALVDATSDIWSCWNDWSP
jgi:hypothetical protein